MPPWKSPPTLGDVPSDQRTPWIIPVVVILAGVTAALADGQPRGHGGGGDLVAAFQRTDFDRLARAGRRLSARGLAPLIAGTRVVEARAAIAAAPYAEDAWQLLADLARLALSPDRRLGPPAAHAGVLIAQNLDPARIAELEIAPSVLRERASAWRAVALRTGSWPDVRVHAIEINAVLVAALPARARSGVELDLLAIAADEEPEVRRAALELEPQPLKGQALERIAEILRADASPVVAIVAGQALCGGIGMRDPAAPRLRALGDAGLERLRNLVANRQLPPRARLDAAQCLRASGKAPDRAALIQLRSSVPRYATREASSLLGGGK